MTAGVDLRHTGQAEVIAADEAVHRGFRDFIDRALHILTTSSDPFTADDVRRIATELADLEGAVFEPHSPNLIPAIFGGWVSSGRLVRVNEYHSARKSRRYGRNGVYRRPS